MRSRWSISHVAIPIVASFALAESAAASVDRFATCAPPVSSVVIGGPDLPPLPPDFFFPGSAPFSGTIILQGSALGPGADTDTIVSRFAEPFLPSDPPGGPVIIPIEIVALHLQSATPIVVNPGAELWDVGVTLPLFPQPSGQTRVTKTHPNGGTFDSSLPVVPRFTFTRISDSLNRVIDYSTLPGPPTITLDSVGAPWVHTPDPSLDVPPNPGTNFFPGIWEQIPGNPSSQVRAAFTGIDPGSAQQTLCTAARAQALPSLGVPGLVAVVLSLLAAAMLAARLHRVGAGSPA